MGWRPTVRGSVMNPRDHPHGGGEGKAPIGRPSPLTPWGVSPPRLQDPQKNNSSDKLIVASRKTRNNGRKEIESWEEALKKGPFVQPVLLKRVQAMNEAGEKRVLKT